MRTRAVLANLAATGLAAGAWAGCVSAKGEGYPQTIAEVGPPAGNHARIVLLRPNQRYDDASLSRIVLRIDDHVLGKLAYGGFLIADVPAGDIVLEASADNRTLFGTCKLPVSVAAGDTLYFDVAPRPANIVATTAGAVAGAAVAGGAIPTPAQTAAGSTTGGVVAGAVESAGKTCGGPYRMTPLAPAVALEHLDRLRGSG